jgi:hypothetical protein
MKATFNAAVPAGTEAFALVISDRLLILQSDGQKNERSVLTVYFKQILISNFSGT